jgi:SAM-dependent methyltransferase
MTSRPWREEWDQQADGWIELTTDDPYYELINRPQFLELVPAPRGLTLEVGCGEGRMARALSARGHRVLGVDGSPALARSATRHASPISAAVGDSARLPINTGVADLVICFMVLMDVEDLDRSVAELARVLAPGGVLCAAIMHPIISSGFFLPDDPNRTFCVGEYRKPMRHVLSVTRANGQEFVFRIAHRPLDDYSRAFEAAGLTITALRETNPTDELVAEHPEFGYSQRVPDFLHIRAQRVDRDGLG